MDPKDLEAVLILLHDLDGHGLTITDESLLILEIGTLANGGWLRTNGVAGRNVTEGVQLVHGVLIPHKDSGW